MQDRMAEFIRRREQIDAGIAIGFDCGAIDPWQDASDEIDALEAEMPEEAAIFGMVIAHAFRKDCIQIR